MSGRWFNKENYFPSFGEGKTFCNCIALSFIRFRFVWYLPLHNGAEVKHTPKAVLFVEYLWKYKIEKVVSCMVENHLVPIQVIFCILMLWNISKQICDCMRSYLSPYLPDPLITTAATHSRRCSLAFSKWGKQIKMACILCPHNLSSKPEV